MPTVQPVRKIRTSLKLAQWRTDSAVALLCFATGVAAQAQTLSVLATFNSTVTGEHPQAALVQGLDGNFYGTAAGGGASSCGTVFRVTPSGVLTVVHSFKGSDGCDIFGGLVLDWHGDWYGTSTNGGANGDGTVFWLTTTNTLHTLHNFSGADGANPNAALIMASDSKLYGITPNGGANGGGTIFKITVEGALTTFYDFCSQPSCADGETPNWPLFQAPNSKFYGTTSAGGGEGSAGTVFDITLTGNLTTLSTLVSGGDAVTAANSGVLLASNGNFYFETLPNSAINDGGGLLEITPTGKEVWSYLLSIEQGLRPIGGLIEGTDGNLYGVAQQGGQSSAGEGSIFQVTPEGVVNTLFSFDDTNGAQPSGPLVQGTDGNFYGTTSFPVGEVFKFSMGLGPFVKTLPSTGPVGRHVAILGTGLTGATSVTFNGTAAAFTVISPTEIQTMVPTGATTGVVQVVTPAGTLSSNVSFQVP